MVEALNPSFLLTYVLDKKRLGCSDNVGKSYKSISAISLKKLSFSIPSVKVNDIILNHFVCNTNRLACTVGDSKKCNKSLQVTNLCCVQMFLKSMSYILAPQLLSSRSVNNSLEVI